MIQPGPVFLPKGFKFSAVKAGIKASGKPDLALIIADAEDLCGRAIHPQSCHCRARPSWTLRRSRKTKAAVRAVIVNSGNANCATGQPGIRDCKRVCAETARILDSEAVEVFPSSTGIIGVPLPVDKITSHLKSLIVECGPIAGTSSELF